MSGVSLYPFGDVEVTVLQYLTIVLPEHLGAPCHVREERLEVSPALIGERSQYHSTKLLGALAERARPGEFALGVTEVDLCIPILTFVFGEALLDRRVALLSLHRLRQPFYGLPADADILLRRAEKESLHELGHAAGLVHCREFSCVMAFSNSVEQVDLKEPAFCPPCRERWRSSWPSAGY